MRHEILLYRAGSVHGVCTVERVTILDDGTGEGAALEALLSCTDPPVGVNSFVDGGVLEYSFGVTDENPRWISVLMPEGDVRYWPRAGLSDRVLGDLTRRRLEAPGPAVRLHAAALADDSGRSVVILGASGAGKSTLAAHLAAIGLDVITDEQLEVRQAPLVVGAFTRPIVAKPEGRAWFPTQLSADGQADDQPWLVPVATFGGRHRISGSPVLLVELDRRPRGATTWDTLSPGEAVCRLAENSLDLVQDYDGGFAALAELAGVSRAIRLRYSSSADAATALVGLMRSDLDVTPINWSVSSPSAAAADGIVSERRDERSDGGAVRLVDDLLAVDIGEELVLARRSTRAVARLDAAGAAALRDLPLDASDPTISEFIAALRDAGMIEQDGPNR